MNKYEKALANIDLNTIDENDARLIREACHLASFISNCTSEIRTDAMFQAKKGIVDWLKRWSDAITDDDCHSHHAREKVQELKDTINMVAETIQFEYFFDNKFIDRYIADHKREDDD